MVTIDIDVKNSLVCFEQFKYTHYTIISITEPVCLKLLCMMEPTRPIYSNFSLTLGNHLGCDQSPSSLPLTVIIHIVKDWAIIVLREETFDVVLKERLLLYRYVFETVNVIICMEHGKVNI